ncbi:MAG: hypothetical protein DRP85_04015 [Candidatus Makaraimicrobium thalassicum]|nr:MAG: hypothetical protein DRP85_04015 [Candidatus Omnitrophota bacterium]
MKKVLILLVCAVCTVWAGASVLASGGTVIVVSYAGDVKVVPAGEIEPVACQPGMLLKEGARIITGEESYVKIAFDRPRSNIVKVKENSEVMIKLEGPDRIELIDGKLFILLRDIKRGETFRVRTPCAVCGARGTGWGVETDGKVADVAVFDGSVFVRSIRKDGSVMEDEYWVERGFERRVEKFERPGRMEKISEARLSAMEKEFDLDKDREAARKKKKTGFDKSGSMREEQMERIQDRKDDERLDSLREKQEDSGGGQHIIQGP